MDDRLDHLPEKVAVFINPACEVAKRRPRQAFTDKNGSEVYDSQFAPYHVDESGRDNQPDDLLNLGRSFSIWGDTVGRIDEDEGHLSRSRFAVHVFKPLDSTLHFFDA